MRAAQIQRPAVNAAGPGNIAGRIFQSGIAAMATGVGAPRAGRFIKSPMGQEGVLAFSRSAFCTDQLRNCRALSRTPGFLQIRLGQLGRSRGREAAEQEQGAR
jgi:hypothetical protein